MHTFPTEFQMHRKIETTEIQYLIDNFSKPKVESRVEQGDVGFGSSSQTKMVPEISRKMENFILRSR